MRKFPVKTKECFLLIGDSITDCGRGSAHAPYGIGYMSLFRELVIARHPERDIRWINRGVSGHTVTHLFDRWEDDVLREKPHWLSIKIGINDLSAHLNGKEHGVPPRLFREKYDAILAKTRKALRARIILIDPFYLSTDGDSDSYRGKVLNLLPEYLAIIRAMARKYGALHVQTQKYFERQMGFREPDDFAPEPIHPNRMGHMVIANALYETLCG